MYDPNAVDMSTYKVEVHVEKGNSFSIQKSIMSEMWQSFWGKSKIFLQYLFHVNTLFDEFIKNIRK